MKISFPAACLLAISLVGCNDNADVTEVDRSELTRSDGWMVQSVAGLDSLPDGAQSWLAFDAEAGRMVGDTACNQMNAAFELDGDQLSLAPIVATKRGCEQPRMVMERAVLESLNAVARWSVSEDMLALRDEAGSVRLTARAR